MDFIQSALDAGFLHAGVVPTVQIPFEEEFRVYCEENLCGQYGVNHSCPPDCGSFQQMHQRMLAFDQALVVQSIWDIADYDDKEAVRQAKAMHNSAMLQLKKQMREAGYPCLMVGASGCSLCKPCTLGKGEPCRFPDTMWSCMSAYCVFVKGLSDLCGMEYNCGPRKMAFYGMLLF